MVMGLEFPCYFHACVANHPTKQTCVEVLNSCFWQKKKICKAYTRGKKKSVKPFILMLSSVITLDE